MPFASMRKPRACLLPDLCLGRLATPENPKNLHDFPSFYLTLISTNLDKFLRNPIRLRSWHHPDPLLVQSPNPHGLPSPTFHSPTFHPSNLPTLQSSILPNFHPSKLPPC